MTDRIIGKNGLPVCKRYTGPVEYNYRDFDLRDFFGKKLTGLKKRNAYHQFFFVGLFHEKHTIGLGLVDLSYIRNIFIFLHDSETGTYYEFNKKILSGKPWRFDRNPDSFRFDYSSRGISISVCRDSNNKSHDIDAAIPRKAFALSIKSEYLLRKNLPVS